MSKIRIRNFGPIKGGNVNNDAWMDIEKVTVFIGNQGSGKSTVAKVISSLTWLEKAINRGDVQKEKVSHAYFYQIFQYQRIKSYFKEDTEIDYIGDKITLSYNKRLRQPHIEIIKGSKFNVPKIMYVPAERNFLSVVKNAYGLKSLPDTLYTFAEELRKGQNELNENLLQLPIGGLNYKYNRENETSYLVGNGYELDLIESSSGYQSLVPLYLVTKFLSDQLQKGENVLREQLNVEQSVRRNKEIAEVMFDNDLTEIQKNEKVKEIDSKYLNTCFVNIVEEPEQNLFPSSQWQILQRLLQFNNCQGANKLILTTHSPYIVNYLSIAIQANNLKNKIKSSDLESRLNNIVPINSTVSASDIVIYQLDDDSGLITRLPDFEGIPTDKNYLNASLAEGNRLFDSLLELEEEVG